MDFSEILRYLQVIVGIGAVIFVHEAGHFIAARLCKVRVEIFSLGFGPRLLGWTRGATTYQVALVPLGGFVKMAGEETRDNELPAPDELRAKTVGQRFFIYSGGVIMNVLFGLVVFPIILTSGVPFVEPVIGGVIPGGVAWEAGLKPGTRVLSIDGHETVGFLSIANEVALAGDEGVWMQVLDPGSEVPRRVHLMPKYQPALGFSTIDVLKPLDPSNRVRVLEGSPAARAGLSNGDRILSIEEGQPGWDLQRQIEWRMERGLPLALAVLGPGEEPTPRRVVVAPKVDDANGPKRLGVQPLFNRVVALRPNPRLDELDLRVDDHLLDVSGTPVLRTGDLYTALLAAPGPLRLRVQRQGRELVLEGPELDFPQALALSEDVALGMDPEATAVAVAAGSPAAAAGLRDGDVLDRIDGAPLSSWSDLQRQTQEAARRGLALQLDVHRVEPSGEAQALRIEAAPAPLGLPSYGFGIDEALYDYRAPSFAAAVGLGVRHSWKFMIDAWTTLKRIGQGRVSGESIGGIITIASVSYSWTALGFAKLMFFLCVLSLNLAFINVLPIPVLDGGHLFFLLIEKIKGSPVSERVFGYSQLVGLVMILTLMIYVMYNDIMRFIPRN